MGSKTTKNQRNVITGTTTFLIWSVTQCFGERSSSFFFPALQGDSDPNRLKLFNFKATKGNLYVYVAKFQSWWLPLILKKKRAGLITLCIPIHGMEMFKVKLCFLFTESQIPTGEREFGDSWSNSFPRSDDWTHGREVTCSGHTIRKGSLAWVVYTHVLCVLLYPPLHPAALSTGHGSPGKPSAFSTPVNRSPTEMSLEGTFTPQLWALPSPSVAHSS